jgi:REP element-mobilizing transposase RayT
VGRRTRDQEAGVHHVITTAVAGNWLFGGTADYEARLALFAAAVRDDRLALNQFCLMGNHEHLLVSVEEGRLGAAMQWINRSYAVLFNARRGRRGRLYDGPYESRIVKDEAYSLWVVTYIALNPEAIAGVTAETHRWSSYASLLGLREPLPFIDDTPIVDWFGGGDAGRARIAEAVDAARGWKLQRVRGDALLSNLVRDEVPQHTPNSDAA